MRRLAILFGFFALTLGAGAGTGWASPILRLQQGTNVGYGTLQPDGTVRFNDSLGTYIISATVGFSNSTLYEFKMDLGSFDVTGPAAGALTITLADTGFQLPSQMGHGVGVFGTVGGTAPDADSVSFQSWVNPGNATLGSGGAIPAGSLAVPYNMNFFGYPSGVGYAGSGTTEFLETGPFSLFSQATFNIKPGVNIISFDQQLSVVPVPEPISLTLLGSGLVGLAAIRRRRSLGQKT